MRKIRISICIGLIFLIKLSSTAQVHVLENQERLSEFIKINDEIYTDQFILADDSNVLYNWKRSTETDTFFNTASMVKSWVSILIGTLIDQNVIESENELVCHYLPQWEDGCDNNVQIKHLLSMSAGILKKKAYESVLAANDMNQFVLDLKLDTIPGVKFSYSNESVQLLGLLIEEVTGLNLSECFNRYLFDPLEIRSTSFAKDDSGNFVAFGGAITTLQDVLKIAQLVLNRGEHKGSQVVSSSWIDRISSSSTTNDYYGYLWWLDNNSANKSIAAMGDFGQLTIIFPEKSLIYLRQQNTNKDISGNMKWMGPAFLEKAANAIVIE